MKTERGYGERYFMALFVHGINGKIEIVHTLKFTPLKVSESLQKAPISDGRNIYFSLL